MLMRIFIGSSSELYPVVKEIKRDLQDLLRGVAIEIIDWKTWFNRGEFINIPTWHIIQSALTSFDLAIMLLADDDKLESRKGEYVVTRDNVLIEAGAFSNALGIENVFLLVAPNEDYKLPSDFLGLNYIKFDYARGADNEDVYRRICEKINRGLSTNTEMIEQPSESLIKNENPITIRKGKGKLI